MEEGAKSQGVWLPLALADIQSTLIALIRMWCAHPENVHVPKRSENLASWCLPMMSKAIETSEKEAEAIAFYETMKMLKEKQEAKGKAK